MEPSKGPLILQSYLIYVVHLWSLPAAHFFCALIPYRNRPQRVEARGSAVRCRGETCSFLQASAHGRLQNLEESGPPHDAEGSCRCLHTCWYRILKMGIYCAWCWSELHSWSLSLGRTQWYLNLHDSLSSPHAVCSFWLQDFTPWMCFPSPFWKAWRTETAFLKCFMLSRCDAFSKLE